jgi:DNA-binding response OmpR family regulator
MKRRILLVDDELTILLTLKAVLEIHGFEVETAASAREAKLKIRSHTYQMVITDMKMESDNSGIEVVHAAKKAPYEPAVAMLTAYPISGTDWRDEGADEMLVKPMNTQDLLLQIEALLVSHEDKKSKRASAPEKSVASATAAAPVARKSASRRS